MTPTTTTRDHCPHCGYPVWMAFRWRIRRLLLTGALLALTAYLAGRGGRTRRRP